MDGAFRGQGHGFPGQALPRGARFGPAATPATRGHARKRANQRAARHNEQLLDERL